jgi:hypothetical protein
MAAIRFCVLLVGTLAMVQCSGMRNVITDVEFDPHVTRSGRSGDNWCMTWGADDDVYTSLCDGSGWKPYEGEKEFFNNRIFRISGGPDSASFQAHKLVPSPEYGALTQLRRWNEHKNRMDKWWHDPELDRKVTAWNWYAYGIVSIDANIYQFISHCAELRGWGWFDGSNLVWRPAGQSDWLRWNGSDANDDDRWVAGQGENDLLFDNEPDYAFSFITIAQYGKDYEQNRDGYVYLYSPNGTQHPEEINLARVQKENILDRTEYEYFQERTPDGGAIWAKNDIEARGAVHVFPEGWGWYSWSPSVVWNEALGLFVMAAGGSQKQGTGDPMDSFMHYETGSLALLSAENPWGPWEQFHYEEAWSGDSEDNRLYEPQLSPKWITDDGRTMYLVYSDARDRHSTNYHWNMQKITLNVEAR